MLYSFEVFSCIHEIIVHKVVVVQVQRYSWQQITLEYYHKFGRECLEMVDSFRAYTHLVFVTCS